MPNLTMRAVFISPLSLILLGLTATAIGVGCTTEDSGTRDERAGTPPRVIEEPAPAGGEPTPAGAEPAPAAAINSGVVPPTAPPPNPAPAAPDAGAGPDDGGMRKPIAACGDGRINVMGEQCDDGNLATGDGCNGICQLEADYVCPNQGQACVATVACGDGRVGGAETCDDGDLRPGDGCDAKCQVEPGWLCLSPGLPCTAARCGDGLIVDAEECDFATPTQGCTNCRIDEGYDCDATACTPTTCGNMIVERGEQCDDGNTVPFDGCYNCEAEPDCSSGSCQAVCGDGEVFPGEACDDGNLRAGDGCAPSCRQEIGFRCRTTMTDPPVSIELPVIYRDFERSHVDMQSSACGAHKGMVETRWGPDRKPVPVIPSPCSGGPQSSASFAEWYNDGPSTETVVDTLELARTGTAGNYTYVFDSAAFFPLTGRGFNDLSSGNNFYFTSEVRFWFQFDASESSTLSFRGDDDVWVFINGVLAVDIGGVHTPVSGSVTLDASSGARFGLQDGGIYEAAVFQAERHTTQSNYRLELQNFFAGTTQCESFCGDGIVASDELCDDGPDGNGGGYGSCTADCRRRGPYCGDSMVDVDAGEACDDGVNLTTYGTGCAPGCVTPPYCGDRIVQSMFEECDEGPDNDPDTYTRCNPDCTLGPYCGDGNIDREFGEECDLGEMNGNRECDRDCKFPQTVR